MDFESEYKRILLARNFYQDEIAIEETSQEGVWALGIENEEGEYLEMLCSLDELKKIAKNINLEIKKYEESIKEVMDESEEEKTENKEKTEKTT